MISLNTKKDNGDQKIKGGEVKLLKKIQWGGGGAELGSAYLNLAGCTRSHRITGN